MPVAVDVDVDATPGQRENVQPQRTPHAHRVQLAVRVREARREVIHEELGLRAIAVEEDELLRGRPGRQAAAAFVRGRCPVPPLGLVADDVAIQRADDVEVDLVDVEPVVVDDRCVESPCGPRMQQTPEEIPHATVMAQA